MRCNLALWDRIFRFIFAVLLLTYVIAGGPFWGWLGLYFLVTSAWGLCPLYSFFRFKTLRSAKTPRNVSIAAQTIKPAIKRP